MSAAQIRKYSEPDTYSVLTYPVTLKSGEWRFTSGPIVARDWMLAGYDVHSRMFESAITTKDVMIPFLICAENDYSRQNFEPHEHLKFSYCLNLLNLYYWGGVESARFRGIVNGNML